MSSKVIVPDKWNGHTTSMKATIRRSTRTLPDSKRLKKCFAAPTHATHCQLDACNLLSFLYHCLPPLIVTLTVSLYSFSLCIETIFHNLFIQEKLKIEIKTLNFFFFGVYLSLVYMFFDSKTNQLV